MKKINPLFVLVVATVILAPSCKKRLIPLPLELCNISGVTVTESGNPDTTVYHITYDREGRPAAIQSTEGGSSSSRTYSYADTNLVVNTSSGGSTTTDSVTLNSQGLMLVDVTRYSSSTSWQTTYYAYNGTEVWVSNVCDNCETPPSQIVTPDSWTYTWSNGNLQDMSQEITAAGTLYGYNSSPAATGDYFSITQLLSAPAPTVVTTNQVDEYSQKYATSAVTYSNYPNGRISGMTIITSGPAMFGYGAPDTVNYSYQYQCEVSFPILDKN
jgi:YD repeat-containing protein